MFFEFDNDDMESSKHCSIFISLTFILKLLLYMDASLLPKTNTLVIHIFTREI